MAAAISSAEASLSPRTEPKVFMRILRVAGPTPGMSAFGEINGHLSVIFLGSDFLGVLATNRTKKGYVP